MASSIDEQILRASKEIVVKFIESGRLSPTAFPETFKIIYNAIEETVKGEAPFDKLRERIDQTQGTD